jgi:coenzyme F420-dependent glucose-6-phosphate dehydrogenase
LPVQFGLTLSSEEHGPAKLVELAEMAEDHGFDFVSISDHYHPWIDAQGHSPFVWTVLGAIAQATANISVGVGVTCPIMRIHPAILAQATATVSNLLPDRFVWGVGTGEALNEQILGDRWPPAPVRLEMLEESIEVIRKLWAGETITHEGEFFLVEDARIYDPPPNGVPVIMSAFGPKSIELAARIADGLWLTGPSTKPVAEFQEAGGSGPVYSQLTVCWGESKEDAVALAHRTWPNTGLPGQLAQDLRTPRHFEQAVSLVDEEMVADSVPCGPDPEPLISAVEEAASGGIDHIYFHQIGPDQEGFVSFWERELQPAISQL